MAERLWGDGGAGGRGGRLRGFGERKSDSGRGDPGGRNLRGTSIVRGAEQGCASKIPAPVRLGFSPSSRHTKATIRPRRTCRQYRQAQGKMMNSDCNPGSLGVARTNRLPPCSVGLAGLCLSMGLPFSARRLCPESDPHEGGFVVGTGSACGRWVPAAVSTSGRSPGLSAPGSAQTGAEWSRSGRRCAGTSAGRMPGWRPSKAGAGASAPFSPPRAMAPHPPALSGSGLIGPSPKSSSPRANSGRSPRGSAGARSKGPLQKARRGAQRDRQHGRERLRQGDLTPCASNA